MRLVCVSLEIAHRRPPGVGVLVIAEERRRQILEHLDSHGMAAVSELARQFGVSEMTVHRDLRKLASQHLITRVHGGAVAKRVVEIPYHVRAVRNRSQKIAIAAVAAKLVRPGMTLFLSPGTTITELMRSLPAEALRIITNSVPIAQELTLSSRNEVLLTGGTVRRYAEALVGPTAEAAVAGEFFHLAFIAVTGVDREAGLTVYSESEARVIRAALKAARKTILLSDSSKFDRVMGPPVAPLFAIHTAVTDTGVPETYRHYFAEHDIDLLVADVAPEAALETVPQP